MTPAVLVLEDGEVFEGVSFGAPGPGVGEVVFNTGMTGYQEVLTDPSYAGQVVAMTYPHIGNYGVNALDAESARPRVAGFVVRDVPPAWSSWRGAEDLPGWLGRWGVPGITEVDTRRLTRHIRDRGAMRGAISTHADSVDAVLEQVRRSPSMVGRDLVGEVTTTEPVVHPADGERRHRVAAYDFGIKSNIVRMLTAHGCEVTVHPAATPPSDVLADGPDGVLLSNGPGDPEAVRSGIAAARALAGRVPLFGICLGHQLLGLALGLPTYKLRFGHRGANHPVVRLADGAVEITTQNHGFALRPEPFGFEPPPGPGGPLPVGAAADTLFGRAKLTHLNLNDHTVEGFRLADVPALAVQYHPEAGPGPHDARYLFRVFASLMDGRGGPVEDGAVR